MKTPIEALRKMTVDNGCTEAEAATASSKLKLILKRWRNLTPEDKARFDEISSRYEAAVEKFAREIDAIEEEMDRLLAKYPTIYRDESKSPAIKELDDAGLRSVFERMLGEASFKKEDHTSARHKSQAKWRRVKRDALISKLKLAWIELGRAQERKS